MIGGGEGWQTTPVQVIVRLRNYSMAAINSKATLGWVIWNKEDVLFTGIRISVPVVQVKYCNIGKYACLAYGDVSHACWTTNNGFREIRH